MDNMIMGSRRARERQEQEQTGKRYCTVAAAVVGSSVLGAISSSNAASAAERSNAAATAAQEKATGDRLAFDKQAYSDGAIDRAFASDAARRASAWQEQDRSKYNGLQDEQVARGRVFQSSEDQLLKDANAYSTEGRSEQLAGRSMASVNAGFDQAYGQQQRAMQRQGVNPSAGAAMAMGNQMSMSRAMGLANAANSSRLQSETTGRAMKMDAVGLGKGMIGNQATQAGLQLSAGNSAVGNSMQPLNVSQAANGAMSQAFGNNAYGNQSLAATQRSNFMGSQAYGAGIGQNVGNAFGQAMQTPGVQAWMNTPRVQDGGFGVGMGAAYNNFDGMGTTRAGM